MRIGYGYNKRKNLRKIAFVLVILISTVFICCAGSSSEKIKESSGSQTEKKVEMSIGTIAGNGISYIAGTKKAESSSFVGISNRNSRFVFSNILFVLLNMMIFISMRLLFQVIKIIKSDIKMVGYIHNKDGKKEQKVFFAV